MGRKVVNKLTDMDIDEVSLVDRGANQHAKVLLHKRLEDEEVEKASPDVGDLSMGEDETPPEDVAPEDEETKKKTKTMEKNFFSRLVNKVLGEPVEVSGEYSDDEFAKINPGAQMPFGMNQQGSPAPGMQNAMPGAPQAFPAGPGQMPGQMQAGPQLPPEVIQYIQQLEQALAQAQGNQPSGESKEDNVPFGKNAEDLSEDEVDFLSELAKNLDDEDTREAINKAMEAVESANERASAAEEIAKAERDFRLNQEYVAKAQRWVNLPVSAEEFGPVLKRLHDTMEEADVEIVERALSSANETLAKSGLFTEVGKVGVGAETISKVDGAAQEIISKNDGMSREQAIAKALEEDPSLYDEYLAENRRA